MNVVQAYLTSGQMPARQGNAHLQIVPYQAFPTADDWLILAVGNDGQWQRFCQAANRAELANDPRFATIPSACIGRDTCADDRNLMRTPGLTGKIVWSLPSVPHAPVLELPATFALEQVKQRGMKLAVRDPAGNLVELVGSPFHLQAPTAAAVVAAGPRGANR